MSDPSPRVRDRIYRQRARKRSERGRFTARVRTEDRAPRHPQPGFNRNGRTADQPHAIQDFVIFGPWTADGQAPGEGR